jgi:DNA-binding transcriptional LysR family regulator
LDKIKGVSVFLQTVKSASFTRAAEQLGVSPQSVSHTVAQLEQSLNVRLFNRTTRSLSLTDEGLRFQLAAQQAMQSFDDALESVAQPDAPTGLVRLSVSIGFGRRYVIPTLATFRKKHPQVNVEMQLDDRKVDLVRDNFDIVIRGGLITDSSLISRRLCNLSSVLVASPDYLRKNGIPKSPRDLVNHQIVQLRFLSGLTSTWAFKRGQVFEPKGGLIFSDPEAVCDAACLGLGIAQVSVHHAWSALRAGQLKIVLCKDHLSSKREVVLQYPHRTYTASRVKVLVEHIVSALQLNPDLQFKSEELAKFAHP